MSYFEAGDRVAWSHVMAWEHGAKSVVRAAAVRSRDPEAQFGTVLGPGNDVGTYWTVRLDGVDEPRVLTTDELVRVEE